MRRSFNEAEKAALERMDYLVGDSYRIMDMPRLYVRIPFDDEIVMFLSDLSRELMTDSLGKEYPDVVTLGFWIRGASVLRLKDRFDFNENDCNQASHHAFHLGRGMVFHIAPSNVPVNFAYSLISGLMTGNANVVRVPSKEFPQVGIIVRALEKVLEKHEGLKPYIVLVRYGHEKEINDVLSSIADVRVVWGGDSTIAEIRKSPLPPRSTEITFADRFSLAVIDSGAYLACEDKGRIASDFYNDTYLSDQNACTSPGLVVWMGKDREEAKRQFWDALYRLVKEKYVFQDIMGVNKLTGAYMMAAHEKGVKIIKTADNLLIRVQIPKVAEDIIELRGNSGYFFEYDCDDITELRELCVDKRVQTIGMIGDTAIIMPLLLSGVRGVDRVVPVGKTMSFDLLWDGYSLYERLTRTVVL